MDLAITCHWHTLVTTSRPPVEGEGGVQMVLICSGIVTGTDQIGVLVYIGAISISEYTPTNSVEIGLL